MGKKKKKKHSGKRRNCSSRAISPFPTVFSKDLNCRHVKARDYLEKGLHGIDWGLTKTDDGRTNSAEQDQTACMYRLILLHTLC